MTLELTFNDYDCFTNKLVFYHSILTSNSLLTLAAALKEFRSKYFYIAWAFNENTVGLDELFVPEEEVVLVNVSDWTSHTLAFSICAANHMINS